jgi:hypothetical protein
MTSVNMEKPSTFDLLTAVGVAALIGQIALVGLMSMNISWAIHLPDKVPRTIKHIIAVMMVSLWANSCASWYNNDQGHFQVALYFALMIFSM